MKNSLIVSFLTAATLLHSPAYGEIVTDLPDPGEGTTNQVTSQATSRTTNQTSQTADNNSHQSKPTPLPTPPPTSTTPVIVIGDRVLYVDGDSTYVGTVLEIFHSGDSRIRFDGYSSVSIINISNLGKWVNCSSDSNSICSGARILYSSGNDAYVGKVNNIYSNGFAQVTFDGYSANSTIRTKELSKAINCSSNGICTSARVTYNDGSSSYTGVVKEVFQNDRVAIKLDGYSDLTFVSSKLLGKSVNCRSSICTGDRVLLSDSSNNYFGNVIEVFSTGKVKVRFDGYSDTSIVSVDSLGKKVTCDTVSGICEGARVLWSNNGSKFAGTVQSVFSNGKAAVKFDDYSDISVLVAKTLIR